jgi:ABC-type Fe3+ transport system permease subunit
MYPTSARFLPRDPRAGRALIAPSFALAVGGAVFVAAAALVAPAAIEHTSPALRVGVAGQAETITTTLAISAAAAALAMLAGVPLGMALRDRSGGRGLLVMRLLSMLPLAVPPLVVALGLARLVDVRASQAVAGIPVRVLLVLGAAHLPAAIAVVSAVVSLAGSGAGRATVETARLLGAGRMRRFVRFEFPALAPVLLLAFVLAFLHAATSLTAIDRLGDSRVAMTAPAAPAAAAASSLPGTRA